MVYKPVTVSLAFWYIELSIITNFLYCIQENLLNVHKFMHDIQQFQSQLPATFTSFNYLNNNIFITIWKNIFGELVEHGNSLPSSMLQLTVLAIKILRDCHLAFAVTINWRGSAESIHRLAALTSEYLSMSHILISCK